MKDKQITQTSSSPVAILKAAARAALIAFAISAPLTASAQDSPEPVEKLQDDAMRAAMSTKPNIEEGLTLSRKLCVNCHLIEDSKNSTARADVPAFSTIANRPEQSTERLTHWLMAPHAPMPDPHLSRTEIRDLTGYILSLRNTP